MRLYLKVFLLTQVYSMNHYYGNSLTPVTDSKGYSSETNISKDNEEDTLPTQYTPLLQIGMNNLNRRRRINLGNVPIQGYRSIRYGKVKTDPENIKAILDKELDGISPDLNSKITKSIEQNKIDRNRFRDVFLIKKRVIQDGNRRIVSFNIKERIIPKSSLQNNDFGTWALLWGILLLLAGLVFTTTIKMYQNLIRRKYLKFENKSEIFEQQK